METEQEYEKRLNAITFGSFHGYEFLKYCKWVLKQEKQMKPTLRNIHQNCVPSLTRYVEEIGKVINLKEHEEMSMVFDDLSRLMINKPHLKDVIMQEVEKAVIKYEKVK